MKELYSFVQHIDYEEEYLQCTEITHKDLCGVFSVNGVTLLYF